MSKKRQSSKGNKNRSNDKMSEDSTKPAAAKADSKEKKSTTTTTSADEDTDDDQRPTDVVVTQNNTNSDDNNNNNNEEHSSDEVSVPTLEGVDEEEEDSYATRRKKRRGSIFGGPKRYFFLALALWLVEFCVVISLKRAGIIEHAFVIDEKIANAVLPQLESSWNRLNESSALAYLTQEKKRPGYQLAEDGAKAKFPVMMVPGFVTSGLEVWTGKECARKYFRQRLWAAFGGARSFLMERDCWLEHMSLDPSTGGDPEGVRMRAASGFEAADYFMGNYWVFGKLIMNLADLGYSPSNTDLLPYDWRLAFPLLESRDGFFSRLKASIEILHRTNGEKVVLASHSMGVQVIHYFFSWVSASEKEGGGGGGKTWVDDHLHAYINIAGSHLGVPKAGTALLSGDISDTAFLGTFGDMIENFFGRKLRRDLWNTWGSLWAMLPQGGDGIWGTGADICNNTSGYDPFCPKEGLSPFLVMTDSKQTRTAGVDSEEDANDTKGSLNATIRDFIDRQSHTVEQLHAFLHKHGAGHGADLKNAKLISSFGEEKEGFRIWHDASRMPLPSAPNMKIYCVYGTGIDTERAYFFQRNREEGPESEISGSGLLDPIALLNASYSDKENNVSYGIKYTDGDGSVPLLSLGYICADAWRRKDTGLNPGNSKVFIREYPHRPEFTVEDPMRGGPLSGEHVDVLGNKEMLMDFLRIASDHDMENVDHDMVSSNIMAIADKIRADGKVHKSKPKKGWFS